MRISIFDLDHTLLKVNSSYQFGKYLYQQKWMSWPTLLLCLMNYAHHKWGGLSIQKIHQNIFSILFNKRPLPKIQVYVKKFLDDQLSGLIYEPALQRLHMARQQGEFIVILSSSPDFLVGPIAERLKVNEWCATQYSEDANQNLSRIAHVLEGEGKAGLVRDLAARLNTSLSACTVYTDSYLDLPMMQIAGKAVGVSPDKKLKKICCQNEWEIL